MKTKAYYLAVLLAAVGCGGGGSSDSPIANLEVQLLSLQGTIGTQAIASPDATTGNGQRNGNDGTFTVEAPDTMVNAAACPLAETNPDPYGTGGDFPGDFPGGATVDLGFSPSVDGGTLPPANAITGVDCQNRSLSVCQGQACAFFAPGEVELAIIDAEGWRTIQFSAAGKSGAAEMALRYRERR